MSTAAAPFVAQLRSRGDILRLAPEGVDTITIRVEMPEVWDTIRVEVALEQQVHTLKAHALAQLFPAGESPDDFVLKLRGWEVLDETASIASAGAVNGSIFLLTYRRRRPVR